MICSFCQHSLARQSGPCDLPCYLDSPIVILVVFPCQGDQQACIGDGVHPREKPLREETSGGPPLITPAYFLQGCSGSLESAVSRDSRTTRPTGRPVRRDFSRSRSSNSSGRRIVSVLLIVNYCNTSGVRLDKLPVNTHLSDPGRRKDGSPRLARNESVIFQLIFHALLTFRSACKCCNAFTFTSPRCSASIPSAAARAAESVVIVGIRAVTAARRIAFSSNQGSIPLGVFTIN